MTERPSDLRVLVVRGGVERGDQRGRTLGFPTANLPIEHGELLDGVWAGWVDCRGQRHAAAISVGHRPTFYGREGFRLLEAHLLDFDAEIYDEIVDVWLCHRLREQRRFAGVAELTAQLAADVAATRAWIGTEAPDAPAVHDALVAVALGVALPVSLTA
ncbi:MAG: riboflavin kinase [Ilumatobacteraceae bacterium]